MKKADNENKKLFLGCYNKSVILTYIGVAIALLGMINIENKAISIMCLVIAGICDLFDGVVARKCKRNDTEIAFGVQIDSLADMISFIALPSMMLIELLREYECFNLLTLLIVSIYAITGITRLAWFNISKYNGSSKYLNSYFDGLPVTYSALIIPITNVVIYTIDNYITMDLHNLIIIINIVVYMVIAIAYVLNIKIKRPSGIWYKIFAVLAVVTILMSYNIRG